MQSQPISWTFWLLWVVAFLGFPIGGLLTSLTIGPVTTPIKAAAAGLITGAVIGIAEWLVLSRQIETPWLWIAATAGAMAVGLAISTAALGSETTGNNLLFRAAITGLCIGLAQAFLHPVGMPRALIWTAVVALGWALGWFITRAVGVDMAPKWSVFGAAGAITYQAITGAALYFLLH